MEGCGRSRAPGTFGGTGPGPSGSTGRGGVRRAERRPGVQAQRGGPAASPNSFAAASLARGSCSLFLGRLLLLVSYSPTGGPGHGFAHGWGHGRLASWPIPSWWRGICILAFSDVGLKEPVPRLGHQGFLPDVSWSPFRADSLWPVPAGVRGCGPLSPPLRTVS